MNTGTDPTFFRYAGRCRMPRAQSITCDASVEFGCNSNGQTPSHVTDPCLVTTVTVIDDRWTLRPRHFFTEHLNSFIAILNDQFLSVYGTTVASLITHAPPSCHGNGT
jgi:hypothetical protein